MASGQPVVAIGGFNGTDPAPTLAQFQQYVSQGKIHYFIAGGRMGGGAFGGGQGSSTASQIARGGQGRRTGDHRGRTAVL